MSEKITREDIGDSIREINAHQKVAEKMIKDGGEKFAENLFNFASGLVKLQGDIVREVNKNGREERG